MKIATFNVNSIKARIDLVIQWLQRSAIDVLCLQELKCEEQNFPFDNFKALGYECEVFGQKQYNGVAICSLLPFQSVQKGFGDDWDLQKRMIYAKINGINIVNLYVPHGDVQGPRLEYKLNFFERVSLFLKEKGLLTQDTIVLGDMNVAKDEIDVYDPIALSGTVGFLEEERQKFTAFLTETKLIDVFRMLHPNERQFTWWDYRGGAIWRDLGMRIDYILATEKATNRIKDIYVDMWPRRRRTPTPSDHAPLIAKIE